MHILKEIDIAHTICFSGHRPDRLPGKGNLNAPETQKLIAVLREHIEYAIHNGKYTFINGLMAGWDVLAAEQIIELRKQYTHIRLLTIAPYSVHFFSREKCWTPEWVNRARKVCRRQDIGIAIAENYRAGIYYERNRTLVDYSSELLCFWDGGKGGTRYTVKYAECRCYQYSNMSGGCQMCKTRNLTLFTKTPISK